MDTIEFVKSVCTLLKDHKGGDVTAIKVTEKTDVADYFVIASGRSQVHARSLAERVDEEASKVGRQPLRSEGVKEGRWAVLDYGDVIVHVFNDETRLFYHLEKLWDDGTNSQKY